MKIAIVDPPYLGRSARWYGDGIGHGYGRGKADHHPDAAYWDTTEAHEALVVELTRDYDGWALAGTPASLRVYLPLCPAHVRIGVWNRGNAIPSGSRIGNQWEPVLFSIPSDRRGHKSGLSVGDVLNHGVQNMAGFVGSKPAAWTRWVLAVLGYDPSKDELTDMFAGSGAVSAAADGLLAVSDV